MNLPRFFFLGLNVGRNTSEGGSVTSALVCFIRVWVARLERKLHTNKKGPMLTESLRYLKISLGIAMEATSFSALGVRFSVCSVSALVESSEVTSLLSRV